MFKWLKKLKQSHDENKEEEEFYRQHQEKIKAIHKEKMKYLDDKLARVRRKREIALAEEELNDEIYDDEDEEDIEEEEETDPVLGFIKAVGSVLVPQAFPKQSTSSPVPAGLSTTKIREFLKTVPKGRLKQFKELSIEEQKAEAKKSFPQLTDEDINNVITVLEAEF